MSVPCVLCGEYVAPFALSRHRQLVCAGTLRPQIKVARKYVEMAQAIAHPEPTLLARAWEQIEDILVETEFVR